MIELIVIVAILGTLAALIAPRMSWVEPYQRTLQRAIIEAIDTARGEGVSLRFRIDKEEKTGTIIAEVLVKDKENELSKKTESTWKTYKMQWQPAGKEWSFKPEIIYFYQNGMCTPAKITWGSPPYSENYLLTVTGFIVETKNSF
jgi:type II secretory pathway pseudopilin PulG